MLALFWQSHAKGGVDFNFPQSGVAVSYDRGVSQFDRAVSQCDRAVSQFWVSPAIRLVLARGTVTVTPSRSRFTIWLDSC